MQETTVAVIDSIANHLSRTSAPLRHAEKLDARPNTMDFVWPVGPGLIRLQIESATGRITAAAHSGTSGDVAAAVLDLFCAAVIDMPLARAVAEAVAIALRRATDDMAVAPVPGVLLPANAGKLFGELQGALNEARKNFAEGSSIPCQWIELTPTERLDRVGAAIKDYMAAQAPSSDAQIVVEAIEAGLDGVPVRVVIADHSVGADFLDGPRILAIERHLKRSLFRAIEVLINERPDRNKLRGKILSSETPLRPIMLVGKKD